MRKAAVTSSQLTESLSRPDKGSKSSWCSQALGGGGAATMCVFCVCCVFFRACVCLWELNLPFYAVRPRHNIANIVVKGELPEETIRCGPGVCKSNLQCHSLPACSDNASL